MADAKNEFTNVSKLLPEALGEPGKRTFRILVESDSSSATIWLEKEQLFQLGLAVQQLLSTLPEQQDNESIDLEGREAPGLTSLDFKVGRLVLGHGGGNGYFIIDAHDLEDDEGEDAAALVRVWASRDQVKSFAEEALRLCAAGRPLCPLCGRAINPDGHECPRVNGHVKITEL